MHIAPLIENLAANLQQCRKERNLALALRLHANICEAGLDVHTVPGNTFVSLLVEVGGVHHAQQIFDRLAHKNQFSWSCLIVGYVNCGELHQAIALYNRMLKADTTHPNEYTFVALLKACTNLKDFKTGQEIFAEIARQQLMESNVFIGSTLVDMYTNCGALAVAHEVFDKLVIRNIVSWNALISGYMDHGCGEEALACFEKLQHEGIPPDAVTLACSLKACGSTRSLIKGEEIHTEVLKKGLAEESVFLGSSLVKMYVMCGALETAREVFDKLLVRNTVVWNALISGYVEHGHFEEALDCFKQLQSEGCSADDVTLVCALKSCDSLGLGQELYTDVVMKGMEENPMIGSGLVLMHAKCGSLVQAQNVFDNLKAKDVVIWTSLIAGYVDHGDCENSLRSFANMQAEETSPSAVTYSCILKACSNEVSKHKGQELHAEATRRGFEVEPLVSRSAVDFYAKCSLLAEAQAVADMLPVEDVACWSTLIVGYIEQGFGPEALHVFKRTQQEGIVPDVVMLVSGLKACGIAGAMEEGKQLHADLCKKGLERDLFVGSTLVDMYAKCGSLADAEEIDDKSLASWNALISGYVEHGHDEKGLDCFKQMQELGYAQDAITYIFSSKACCNLGATRDGQNVHAEAARKGLESELLISNSFIEMYAKCGLIAEALYVFNTCPSQTIVLWTAIIAGCIDQGCSKQALYLFEQMQENSISPTASTFSCILRACGSIKAEDQGEQMPEKGKSPTLSIFSCISRAWGCIGPKDMGEQMYTEIVKKGMLEESVSLGSSLVDMYVKEGFLGKAEEVFNKLPVQDAVSWTVLIAGYAEHGPAGEALLCFEQMQHEGILPLLVTFVSVLKACGRLRAADRGQVIHSEIAKKGLEREPYIGNTLVDMYGKCSLLAEARQVFLNLLTQNVVSCTSLTKAYTESRSDAETLELFDQVNYGSVSKNAVAMVGILKACGSVATLAKGQETHAEIAKKGFEEEQAVGNTLVDMYAKCGSLAEAENMFGKLSFQDVVSWTSLIIGYSQVGMSEHVICLFDNMVAGGVRPDLVTILSVLSALSHTGLVDKGQMYFEAMSRGHDLTPSLKHYTCLVDLLSRAGLIEKAAFLIQEMPIHPGFAVWLTLLGACRNWGNLDIGKDAFEHAVKLNEKDSAPYVCMANIYVDAAMDIDANVIHFG